MLSDVVAILRKLVRMLLAGSAPGQLATGLTLGMIIGILPKSNLIALSLCVLLFSLRCNKGLGLVAAIAFSSVGPWTDPFAHKLGLAVLHIGSLQTTYASLMNMPLGPWLGFNNTVVSGTFLMGLYVAYPVYWTAQQIFAAVQSVFGTKPAVPLTHSTTVKPRAAA
jgi:uncharacterized protein (TIGR03546 family)